MKRYLVFAFREYYPSGGMQDLYGNYDTINEVMLAIEDIIKEDDGRYNINVLDSKVMTYTDTYDILTYFEEEEKYGVDKDELNNIYNELSNFNKLS